ncbi:MAG: hypothetical protein Q9162_004235 [Coniocarpon cinnabarinum]
MSQDPPESPTARVLRFIPNDPFVLDVPSEKPYPNRPDQVAYEYARMAGTTFRTRDDDTNEIHLQHMSFLNRDVGGTLLTQHPLLSLVAAEPAEQPPAKRVKLDKGSARSTPSTPTVKKKITLQDYRNKSAARSTPLASSTPQSHPQAPTPERSLSTDSYVVHLKDKMSQLLSRGTIRTARKDEWALTFPNAVQAPKPATKAPAKSAERSIKPSKKGLATSLQENGRTLKKRYESLAKTLESKGEVSGRKKVEKQILALAVESVICFMRSFAIREEVGESSRKLWPTLYQMLDLVSHRAKGNADVVMLVGILDTAVAEQAVIAFGKVKWEDMKDEPAKREGWEGVRKAVERTAKRRDSLNSGERWRALSAKTQKAIEGSNLTGVRDILAVCKIATLVLEEWRERENIG